MKERRDKGELFNGIFLRCRNAPRERLEEYRGRSPWCIKYVFWVLALQFMLLECGARSIVIPPSLNPTEETDRVKADPRDGPKLAECMAKGLLKCVRLPTATGGYAFGSSGMQVRKVGAPQRCKYLGSIAFRSPARGNPRATKARSSFKHGSVAWTCAIKPN